MPAFAISLKVFGIIDISVGSGRGLEALNDRFCNWRGSPQWGRHGNFPRDFSTAGSLCYVGPCSGGLTVKYQAQEVFVLTAKSPLADVQLSATKSNTDSAIGYSVLGSNDLAYFNAQYFFAGRKQDLLLLYKNHHLLYYSQMLLRSSLVGFEL